MCVCVEAESQSLPIPTTVPSACEIQNTLPRLCPPAFHVASSLLYIYSALSLVVSRGAFVSWRANPEDAPVQDRMCVCVLFFFVFWPRETLRNHCKS